MWLVGVPFVGLLVISIGCMGMILSIIIAALVWITGGEDDYADDVLDILVETIPDKIWKSWMSVKSTKIKETNG